MNIFAICGCALITVAAFGIIKELKPSAAPFCAAAAGLSMVAYIVSATQPIIDFFTQLNQITGGSISVMIKALGVAVCCNITAEICRECGEASSAAKVELAAKTAILLLALPLIKDIINLAGDLAG